MDFSMDTIVTALIQIMRAVWLLIVAMTLWPMTDEKILSNIKIQFSKRQVVIPQFRTAFVH